MKWLFMRLKIWLATLGEFCQFDLTDPFIYRKPFAQASKYAQLNVENLLVSNRLRTGVFASYQLLDYHPKALDYLGKIQVFR